MILLGLIQPKRSLEDILRDVASEQSPERFDELFKELDTAFRQENRLKRERKRKP
jgi:hypothetical protein